MALFLASSIVSMAAAPSGASTAPERVAAALVTTTTTALTTTTTVAPPPAPTPPPAPVQRASRGARQRTPIGEFWSDPAFYDLMSKCEANNDPTRISRSGKFWGAFQFMLDSWRRAGETNTPIDYPYEYQRDVAMRWAHMVSDPWGQWPICSYEAARNYQALATPGPTS